MYSTLNRMSVKDINAAIEAGTGRWMFVNLADYTTDEIGRLDGEAVNIALLPKTFPPYRYTQAHTEACLTILNKLRPDEIHKVDARIFAALCTDLHNLSKFVSNAYNREAVIRHLSVDTARDIIYRTDLSIRGSSELLNEVAEFNPRMAEEGIYGPQLMDIPEDELDTLDADVVNKAWTAVPDSVLNGLSDDAISRLEAHVINENAYESDIRFETNEEFHSLAGIEEGKSEDGKRKYRTYTSETRIKSYSSEPTPLIVARQRYWQNRHGDAEVGQYTARGPAMHVLQMLSPETLRGLKPPVFNNRTADMNAGLTAAIVNGLDKDETVPELDVHVLEAMETGELQAIDNETLLSLNADVLMHETLTHRWSQQQLLDIVCQSTGMNRHQLTETLTTVAGLLSASESLRPLRGLLAGLGIDADTATDTATWASVTSDGETQTEELFSTPERSNRSQNQRLTADVLNERDTTNVVPKLAASALAEMTDEELWAIDPEVFKNFGPTIWNDDALRERWTEDQLWLITLAGGEQQTVSTSDAATSTDAPDDEEFIEGAPQTEEPVITAERDSELSTDPADRALSETGDDTPAPADIHPVADSTEETEPHAESMDVAPAASDSSTEPATSDEPAQAGTPVPLEGFVKPKVALFEELARRVKQRDNAAQKTSETK